MKIHFLGTAAAEGFPNPFCRCDACSKARSLGGKNIRTRSSILIDDLIKVDYSADSHMQALRDRIDLGAVEHLLFTHTHYDHFQPSDLYNRIEGFAHGIDHPLHIYGNDIAISQTVTALGPDAGGRFAFHLLRPFETISLGGTRVTPLLANHDPMETCLLFYIEKGAKHYFTAMTPDGFMTILGNGFKAKGSIWRSLIAHIAIRTISEIKPYGD